MLSVFSSYESRAIEIGLMKGAGEDDFLVLGEFVSATLDTDESMRRGGERRSEDGELSPAAVGLSLRGGKLRRMTSW